MFNTELKKDTRFTDAKALQGNQQLLMEMIESGSLDMSRYKGSVLVHWVPGAGAGASTKIKYEIIEKVNKI